MNQNYQSTTYVWPLHLPPGQTIINPLPSGMEKFIDTKLLNLRMVAGLQGQTIDYSVLGDLVLQSIIWGTKLNAEPIACSAFEHRMDINAQPLSRGQCVELVIVNKRPELCWGTLFVVVAKLTGTEPEKTR